MSKRYEDEQAEISETIKKLKSILYNEIDKAETTSIFIFTVKKYTRIKKLTPRMLNELIDHIEIHQSEKIDGVQIQKINIHYNCIGSVEIPDLEQLRLPKISNQTRKGVAVTYAAT